jgi:hypothetical protein
VPRIGRGEHVAALASLSEPGTARYKSSTPRLTAPHCNGSANNAPTGAAGIVGPAVAVPSDASAQDRLLGAMSRQP